MVHTCYRGAYERRCFCEIRPLKVLSGLKGLHAFNFNRCHPTTFLRLCPPPMSPAMRRVPCCSCSHLKMKVMIPDQVSVQALVTSHRRPTLSLLCWKAGEFGEGNTRLRGFLKLERLEKAPQPPGSSFLQMHEKCGDQQGLFSHSSMQPEAYG